MLNRKQHGGLEDLFKMADFDTTDKILEEALNLNIPLVISHIGEDAATDGWKKVKEIINILKTNNRFTDLSKYKVAICINSFFGIEHGFEENGYNINIDTVLSVQKTYEQIIKYLDIIRDPDFDIDTFEDNQDQDELYSELL